MSATRDKNQKIAFVYSNFYELYRKSKQAALQSNPDGVIDSASRSEHPVSGQVLKAGDLRNPIFAEVRVRRFEPPRFIAKRVEARPAATRAGLQAMVDPSRQAVESLQQSLRTLNDLHSRLRFMLQELEELIRE